MPAGQQHEVRERLERVEREEDGQPSLQGLIATATPTPIGTLTPTATPTGTPTETPALPASPTEMPTPTVTPTATPTPTVTPTSTPSIGDASVIEGSSGTTSAVFTVTVSGASNETVTVGYATANDTATGGTCGTTGVDYQSTSGTLSIPPGATSRTIAVPVCGDALDEPDEETFVVNLSGPTNATIADGRGTGTIADDDRRPTTTEATCDFDPELEARRCTATVIDTGSAPPTTLTGTVSFRSSTESTTFDPNPCTLSGSDATASCSAIVGMTDFEDQTVTGAYSGDAAHAPSSGSDDIVFRLLRKIR
ncbi:MAG: hypothetical protein M3O34_09045 [Chloroflexota bacterium]|nr:hypothetical protein [Chloroflexota bacterium]